MSVQQNSVTKIGLGLVTGLERCLFVNDRRRNPGCISCFRDHSAAGRVRLSVCGLVTHAKKQIWRGL